MTRLKRRVVVDAVVVVAGVVVGAVTSGCPSLAQFSAFSGVREGLVADCCACLAETEVLVEGASCTPATLDSDGNVVLPDDALTADEIASGDVDPVPCLCGASEAVCTTELNAGHTIQLPGACVDQVTLPAPCEGACSGVLSYESIASD